MTGFSWGEGHNLPLRQADERKIVLSAEPLSAFPRPGREMQINLLRIFPVEGKEEVEKPGEKGNPECPDSGGRDADCLQHAV